jgi:hypothetical protein
VVSRTTVLVGYKRGRKQIFLIQANHNKNEQKREMQWWFMMLSFKNVYALWMDGLQLKDSKCECVNSLEVQVRVGPRLRHRSF